MIKNEILLNSVNGTGHGTLNDFAYMDPGSSKTALCAIILLIGIGLYFSRKPLKKWWINKNAN